MSKKVSAIAAIIRPFEMKSCSTQTFSEPKQITLGGNEVTVSVCYKGTWKTKTTIEGGTTLVVTHRIRTGKTAKDKLRGHTPYKKNRRIWEDGGTGRNSAPGRWVKA